jgi:hypothetical protein
MRKYVKASLPAGKIDYPEAAELAGLAPALPIWHDSQ